jgi:hypothetical protein
MVQNQVGSAGSLGGYVMYVRRVHNKTYTVHVCVLSAKMNRKIYTYQWIMAGHGQDMM